VSNSVFRVYYFFCCCFFIITLFNYVCSTVFSLGHADAEIEAVFAKYDLDGDRILNEAEQKKMQEDLEGQKVSFYFFIYTLGIVNNL